MFLPHSVTTVHLAPIREQIQEWVHSSSSSAYLFLTPLRLSEFSASRPPPLSAAAAVIDGECSLKCKQQQQKKARERGQLRGLLLTSILKEGLPLVAVSCQVRLWWSTELLNCTAARGTRQHVCLWMLMAFLFLVTFSTWTFALNWAESSSSKSKQSAEHSSTIDNLQHYHHRFRLHFHLHSHFFFFL